MLVRLSVWLTPVSLVASRLSEPVGAGRPTVLTASCRDADCALVLPALSAKRPAATVTVAAVF